MADARICEKEGTLVPLNFEYSNDVWLTHIRKTTYIPH